MLPEFRIIEGSNDYCEKELNRWAKTFSIEIISSTIRNDKYGSIVIVFKLVGRA